MINYNTKHRQVEAIIASEEEKLKNKEGK